MKTAMAACARFSRADIDAETYYQRLAEEGSFELTMLITDVCTALDEADGGDHPGRAERAGYGDDEFLEAEEEVLLKGPALLAAADAFDACRKMSGLIEARLAKQICRLERELMHDAYEDWWPDQPEGRVELWQELRGALSEVTALGLTYPTREKIVYDIETIFLRTFLDLHELPRRRRQPQCSCEAQVGECGIRWRWGRMQSRPCDGISLGRGLG